MAISNNSEQIKLLVVEDNPVIQFAITSMLEDLGYLFDTAKDGASAIKLALENNDYSLILMDIDLPDMSGIQVTEVLLSLQNTQYVPIVAITSHTEPEYIKRCYAVQMLGFYNNPRTTEDIKNIINANIGINRAVAA